MKFPIHPIKSMKFSVHSMKSMGFSRQDAKSDEISMKILVVSNVDIDIGAYHGVCKTDSDPDNVNMKCVKFPLKPAPVVQ